MLDWDTFRVVIAISREGSLSRAAKSLGISQPTVGRYLSRLEERLGAKLFDRFNSGLFPTPTGQVVINSAIRLEQEIQTLNLRVNSAEDAEVGEVRVSLPLHIMPHGLAKDIGQFTRKHPQINLTFLETNECIDIHARSADVIVRVQNEPSSGLWGYRLTELKFGFFAAKSLLEEWKLKINQSPETVELPYFDLTAAGEGADIDILKKKFPNAQRFGTCSTYDTLIPLVREGLGVGRIARFMADQIPDLVMICECDATSPRSMWVLTHPTLRDTQRIRLFMDFLRDQFRAREMAF